jgi:hypothetical protein
LLLCLYLDFSSENGAKVVSIKAIADSAQRLSVREEAELELLLELRARAIVIVPALKDDPGFEPRYETDTIRLYGIELLGRRILGLWIRELYAVVCEARTGDQSSRNAIFDALNSGEAAVIAAVASVLLAYGAPAALATVVAPLAVKKFIMPGQEELCPTRSDEASSMWDKLCKRDQSKANRQESYDPKSFQTVAASGAFRDDKLSRVVATRSYSRLYTRNKLN